jgi:prepilin-type N-terminal cleavage/methylation domain-containing protein
MRPDDGYTLPEMLVALALVGLAMTGLAITAHLLVHVQMQWSAVRAQAQAMRRLDAAFAPPFSASGPFFALPNAGFAFVGDPEGAAFDCGHGQACRLHARSSPQPSIEIESGERVRVILLPKVASPRFAYVSAATGQMMPRWPPEGSEDDRLAGVIVADGDRPMAFVSLPREQAAACAFDAATHECIGRAERPQ